MVNAEESTVSLSASDQDTEPENLIWSIAGTPRELTAGTTVSFVTDAGSSSTVRQVVLLFERPERSTAGASVCSGQGSAKQYRSRGGGISARSSPRHCSRLSPTGVSWQWGSSSWHLELPVISDEPIEAVTLTVSVRGEWLTENQSSVTVTTLGETERTSSYLITFSPLSGTVGGAVTYWLDYADRSGERGIPVASAKVLTLEHGNGCGVETDGEIFCWGTPFLKPEDSIGERLDRQPPEGGGFAAITSDVVWLPSSNYCAIRDTGQADCWGAQYDPDRDPYPSNGRYRSVASVFKGTCAVESVEIASPGPIVCEADDSGSPPPPDGDFLSVTGGAGLNACALDREGKASCWGLGSAVNNTPADERFSALAMGSLGACGIQIEEDAKPGGALACWGGGYGMIPEERFLNISAANNSYCGITVEHRMRCWGDADVQGSGDFPAPSTDTTLVAVAVSGDRTWACAVNGSGTAECWGDDNTAGRLTGATGRYFGTVVSLDPPVITSLRHTASTGRIGFFDMHLDFPGSLYINFVQEGGSTPTVDEVVRRAKAGSLLALRRSFESGGSKTLRLPYLGEGNFRAYFVTENAVGPRTLSTLYWTVAQFSGEEPPLLFADKGALPGSRNIDLYARLGEKFTMEFETVSSETRVTPTVWIGGIRVPATLITVTGQFPTQDDGHDDGSYVVAVETTVVEGVQGAVTYRVEYANQRGVAGVPVFTPQYISGGDGFYCVLLFDGKVKCHGVGSPDGRFSSMEAASNRICGIRFDGTAHCWAERIPSPAPVGSSFRSIAVAAEAGCGLDIHGFAEGFCTSTNPGVTVDDFEQSDVFRDLDIGTRQPCGLKSDGSVECSKFGTRLVPFKLGAGAQLSDPLDYMVVPQGENFVCGVKREDKSIVCSDGRVPLPVGGQYLTFAANASGFCGIALDGENANKLVCKGGGSGSAPTPPPSLEGGDGEYVSVGLYLPTGSLPSARAIACGITKLGDLRCQGASPLKLGGLQKVGFYVDGVLPKLVDRDFPSVFRNNVTASFAPSELSTVYAVFTDESGLTDEELMEMSTPVSLSTGERFEKTYSSAGDGDKVARDYYFYVVLEDAVLNRSSFRSTMREIGSSPKIVDGTTTLRQIYAKETMTELTLRASDPNLNEATSLTWSLDASGIPAGTTVVFATDAGSSSTARGDMVTVLFKRPQGSTAGASVEVSVKDPEGNTDSLTVRFQSIPNREPKIIGSLERELKRDSPTTLTFEASDADPGDDPNLQWTLSGTGTLTGSVKILHPSQGTGIEVRFVPETGSSMYGSFELNVSDQLSTTTTTVKLIYGFRPVIEGGASTLKRLIYVKQKEARLGLAATDRDTLPEELNWSIVGTPRELVMGTTVSFVLAGASTSSTARGSMAVLLFERPEGSMAGASVGVEVRDPQNNTARTTVQFVHQPNSTPVIIGAIGGKLVEVIPTRGGEDLPEYSASDADPGDADILVWSLDDSGLSGTATILEFPPVGTTVSVVIELDIAATEPGTFELKVSDLLSTVTATVVVISDSEPKIEGGSTSVKSLIYAKQTTAERSLTAKLEGGSVDRLLWSIASTSLPTGATVSFVLADASRSSTASGGKVNVLYERPEGEPSGSSVVVVVSRRDKPSLMDDIVVIFEAIPNRPPVIVGGSTTHRVSASDTMTVLMFEASDEDPGHGVDLQWTLDAGMLSSATAVFDSTRGENVEIMFRPDIGATIFGSFQLAVTDDLATDTVTVSLTYGFPPVIENGESTVVRMVYAKETRSTVSLSASDPDTAPEHLIWSIAGTPRELAMGTTVNFVLAGASTSSTARGSTVVVLLERPDGRSGSTIVVVVTDLQNHSDKLVVVFEPVSNRPPVIVGDKPLSRRLIFPEAATTALLAFEAEDDDPGHAMDLRWSLNTGMSNSGSAGFYGSEDARGSTIQILYTRDTQAVDTTVDSIVLEVTDGLSTDSVTVELIYVLPPVIEDGSTSVKSLIYATQTMRERSLTAEVVGASSVDDLLWSIVSTDTGTSLPTGTTVSFVLAGASSIASGGKVSVLYERPEGELSGGSVVVVASNRDEPRLRDSIVVIFEAVANRFPVIDGGSTRWEIPAGASSAIMAFSATDEDPPDSERLEWSIEDCSNVLGGSVNFSDSANFSDSVNFSDSATCDDTQTGTNIEVEFIRDASSIPPGGSFRLKVTDGLAGAEITVSLEPELEPETERLRARVYLGGAVR